MHNNKVQRTNKSNQNDERRRNDNCDDDGEIR